MKLHFIIDKTDLKRTDENVLASYSKNVDKCIFRCKGKWEDIYKYALFTDVSNAQYIVPLGLGSKVKCIIPDKVMQGNYFSVSVFGDNRYTTVQEDILIQPSGFTNDTESAISSGKSEVSSSSLIDIDTRKRWHYCEYRHNIFEIQEHPYL